jgi:hypothetical protein
MSNFYCPLKTSAYYLAALNKSVEGGVDSRGSQYIVYHPGKVYDFIKYIRYLFNTLIIAVSFAITRGLALCRADTWNKVCGTKYVPDILCSMV